MKDTPELILDMIKAIISIESYSPSMYDEFLQNEKSQAAIMYHLIILGEAANKIPEEFKHIHPEIPWPSIIGTRHIIIHAYDQVKLEIVWDIVDKNLLSLKNSLLQLI